VVNIEPFLHLLWGVLQILEQYDDMGCGINSMEHGATATIFIATDMENPWGCQET